MEYKYKLATILAVFLLAIASLLYLFNSKNVGQASFQDLGFSASSGGLVPIGRWDTIPHQRIDASNPINLSLIAFSKNGIQQVKFIINGPGVSNLIKTIEEMTYNSQTGVWEYWVPLSINEFSDNGVVTVDVVITGNDGGVRDRYTDTGTYGTGVETLTFIAVKNPTGRYQKVYAWVDPGGDDGITNGVRTSATDPGTNNYFATVRGAATAIQAYRSSNFGANDIDGGTIFLKGGIYSASGSGSTIMTNEWLTITRASNVASMDNVKFIGANSLSGLNGGHIKGLTVSGTSIATSGSPLWIDEVHALGCGKWPTCDLNGGIPTGPFGSGDHLTETYWTNGDIEKANFPIYQGSNAKIIRGMYIHDFSNDPFQAAPLVINTVVHDMRGNFTDFVGNRQPHADLFQPGSDVDNYILYNVKATGLHYDIFFSNIFDTNAEANGIAFVNVMAETDLEPIYGMTPDDPMTNFGDIKGRYNHLIMWHNTFIRNDGEIGYPIGFSATGGQYWVKHSSIVGNVFEQIYAQPDESGKLWYKDPAMTDYDNEISDNHFNYSEHCPFSYSDCHVIVMGVRNSTGDPKLDQSKTSPDVGKPLAGSVLINRINSPRIPADLDGKQRPAVGATVGAYEASQPCTTNEQCNNGKYCDGVETCSQSGNCVPGNSPCTADSYSCTETCNDVTDTCNVPDNSLCDDSNVCTTHDRCLGNGGAVGTGCAYDFAPITTTCDDGNSCTAPDKCNGGGACQGTEIPGCVACTTIANSWQNNAFASQTGSFTVQFTAKPNQAGTNGLVCLSDGAGSSFPNFAVLVGFGQNGYLNARDGSTYRADTQVQYVIGKKYNFSVDVDMAAKRYDVRVTPEGGSEILLANDYQFRTEQAAATALNNWGAIADKQTMDLCGFKLITEPLVCKDNDTDGYNQTGNGCGPADCDDGNPNIHPNALELCNGADDNCNGNTDEGCPSTELVMHLKFDDSISDGIATDSSGKGNNGRCGTTHGTICPAYSSAGKSNGALDFDGTNDKAIVIANSNDINVNSQFTFSLWIKTRSDTATDEYQAIVVKGAENGDLPRQYALYLNFGELQSIWSYLSRYYYVNTAGTSIQKDNWYHLAYVRDSTKDNFYVNGALVSSVSSPAQMELHSDTNLRIGGLQVYSDERFNGLIDEVRMYNKALTASEVLALYNEFTSSCNDSDGDSFNRTGGICGPIDCNDDDPNINPVAREICNNKDDDCNIGTIDGIDETWYNTPTSCGIGECLSLGVLTCTAGKQTNTCIPGMPVAEVCDGLDNNCDNVIDNGGDILCADNIYCDGNEKCMGILGCIDGNPIDCSNLDLSPVHTCTNNPDNKIFTWDSFKGFKSTCDEVSDSCTVGTTSLTHTCNITGCGAQCEKDSDCSDSDPGTIDSCLLNCSCMHSIGCVDKDHDGYSMNGGSCGTIDCDDNSTNIYPGSVERCNGVDDNCENGIDEGCDSDNDDYCDKDMIVAEPYTCIGTSECCLSGKNDCDDSENMVKPLSGSESLLYGNCFDNLDNDCDTKIDSSDEDCLSVCSDEDFDELIDYSPFCTTGIDFCVQKDYDASPRQSIIPTSSKYNFSNVSTLADLRRVNNFTVSMDDKKRIEFLSNISLIDINLTGCFIDEGIEFENLINITDTAINIAPAFKLKNKAAYIYFYGSFNRPKLLSEGQLCADCQMVSNNGGVMKYHVIGLKNYLLLEDSCPAGQILCSDNVCRQRCDSGRNNNDGGHNSGSGSGQNLPIQNIFISPDWNIIELDPDMRYGLIYGGENYRLFLASIRDSYIDLSILSVAKLRLSKGKVALLDPNQDGKNELEFRYDGLDGKKVILAVKEIDKKPISKETNHSNENYLSPAEIQPAENGTVEERSLSSEGITGDSRKDLSKSLIIMAIVLFGMLILIVIFVLTLGKPHSKQEIQNINASDALKTYILRCLSLGYSRDKIFEECLRTGWKKEVVEQAFREVKKT